MLQALGYNFRIFPRQIRFVLLPQNWTPLGLNFIYRFNAFGGFKPRHRKLYVSVDVHPGEIAQRQGGTLVFFVTEILRRTVGNYFKWRRAGGKRAVKSNLLSIGSPGRWNIWKKFFFLKNEIIKLSFLASLLGKISSATRVISFIME
jgi:hypothetical protein